jgi:hypothetical protein
MHGKTRNTDNAPLFTKKIKRFGGFLGQTDDTLDSSRNSFTAILCCCNGFN